MINVIIKNIVKKIDMIIVYDIVDIDNKVNFGYVCKYCKNWIILNVIDFIIFVYCLFN